MGRNNTGGFVDGQEIRRENIYCQLCLENGCQICVCSLFYVIITHLNLFVCVWVYMHVSTSTLVTGQCFILRKAVYGTCMTVW